MSGRAVLQRERLLLFLQQFSEEEGTGWQTRLAEKTGMHQTTWSRLVNGSRRAGDTTAYIDELVKAFRLRWEFFTDATLDQPSWRDFVGKRGVGETVERDEATLRAVEEMVSDLLTPEERSEYEEHDLDWARGLAFKNLRSVFGTDTVRAQGIYGMWRERRAARRGKATAQGQRAQVTVREGRVPLGDDEL